MRVQYQKSRLFHWKHWQQDWIAYTFLEEEQASGTQQILEWDYIKLPKYKTDGSGFATVDPKKKRRNNQAGYKFEEHFNVPKNIQ